MLSRLSSTQKGILSAFSGFTAFAMADACSKWLGAYYNSVEIIFWVYTIAIGWGLVLSPMLGGLKATLKTKKLRYHLGRGICALAVGLLVVTALSNGLQLATMYTVLFLAPFLTTLAAIPIYKEKVSRKNWLIIAVGFSGILVAFHEGLDAITPEISLIFLALIFVLGLALLARPLNETDTLLSLSFFPSLVITGITAVFLLPNIEIPQTQHLIIFFFDGLFVVIGLSGIAHGFRIAPYAYVSPIHYTQMVVALALGYFIFGDIPDLWMMAGACIIIASGIFLITHQKHPKPDF